MTHFILEGVIEEWLICRLKTELTCQAAFKYDNLI